MTSNKQSKSAPLWPIIFAIVCLVNPTVKVVDVLPDFIACFILLKYLAYPAMRAPYFDEARRQISYLALLGIAKIPAYLLISFARSNNVQDYDTGVLVTLVFTVIECTLLIMATGNLFSGIFYLGERTDASSLISSFYINKKKTHTMTPESLKTLTTVFIIAKSACCLLPEMLLLSTSVDPGIHQAVVRPMRYYPYTIILAVIVAFVFCIFYAKRAIAFVRTIASEGKFVGAIDSLADELALSDIERREKIKAINLSLTLFCVASLASFDLCFTNFGGANLLPHFVFGIMIIIALVSTRNHTKKCIAAYVVSAMYIVVSAIAYAVTITFIDEYGYSALVKNMEAKSAYLPVIFLAILEFCILASLMILVGVVIMRVIRTHAMADKCSSEYSVTDAKYDRAMRLNVTVMTALGCACGLTKLLDVIFKYFATQQFTATEGVIGSVAMGLIPWFGTVVFVASLIYVGYTCYLLSAVKEDVEMRYTR